MRARDLDALGFPKLLDALAARTVSALGAEACRALRPARDLASAARVLDRQWAFFRLLEMDATLPLAPFADIREALALAAHEGAVLTGKQLLEVRTVLRQVQSLHRFFQARRTEWPDLADLPARLHAFPELEAALSRMLDDDGLLRDGASPRLAELRAALRDLRQEIEERLAKIVNASAADAFADRYVTVRNNRFVVPLKAGAASRVAGVVQDRSASGETLFIEPLFAIELNNRLLLLAKEEELEELRLLTLLTTQVGSARDELVVALAALAEIDRLAAVAAFARRFHCMRPALADRFELRQARHPELLATRDVVTPVDIRIGDGKRALVISGPNTGGKSVALKTLGLLVLMAQSGILIPAAEGSSLPFVRALHTDLADDQSIERNLSTFSAHIVNLVEIVADLAPPVLVLLDEPGTGTDPEEGASLAVALLDRLLGAGALVAVATHYAPVKLYALNEPRIEIASVDVDAHTFEPRFRLLYGSVGASLGLRMARRLALPSDLIDVAEQRQAASTRELASAIERLEASRRRLDDERTAVEEERRALAEVEREHAALVAELRDRRRSKWQGELEEAREFVRTLKAEGRELLDVIRRRPPDAARALADFVRDKREVIESHATALDPTEREDSGRPPVIGDTVEIRDSQVRGELVEIAGGSARIRRGTLTFQVPADRIRIVSDSATAATARRSARRTQEWGVQGSTNAERGEPLALATTEVHLIGMRVREALEKLDGFLDQAQQRGTSSVRIVHGIGTGALKKAVADYLSGSPYCTGFHEAPANQGGAGATIVDLG